MSDQREGSMPKWPCPSCGMRLGVQSGKAIEWGCGTTSHNASENMDGAFVGDHILSSYCRAVCADREIAKRARDFFSNYELAAEHIYDRESSREFLFNAVRRG